MKKVLTPFCLLIWAIATPVFAQPTTEELQALYAKIVPGASGTEKVQPRGWGLAECPFPGFTLVHKRVHFALFSDTEFAQAAILFEILSLGVSWAPQELRDRLGLRERDLCYFDQDFAHQPAPKNNKGPRIWVQSGRLYIAGEERWIKEMLERWYACEAEYPEPQLRPENLKTLEVSVPKTEYQHATNLLGLVPTYEKHVTKMGYPIVVHNPQSDAPEPAKVRMVLLTPDWKSISKRKRPQIPGYFASEGGSGENAVWKLNVGVYTPPVPGFVYFLHPGRHCVRIYHLDADDQILAWGETEVDVERVRRVVPYAGYLTYGFTANRERFPYQIVAPNISTSNAPYTCKRPVLAEEDFQKINPNLVMLNEVTLKSVETGTRELGAVENQTPFLYHLLDKKTGDIVGVRVTYAPTSEQAVRCMTIAISSTPIISNIESWRYVQIRIGEIGIRRGDERFGRYGCFFIRGCTVFHVSSTLPVEREHEFARALDDLYVEHARKLNPGQQINSTGLAPKKLPVTEIFKVFFLRQMKERTNFLHEYTRLTGYGQMTPEEQGILLTGNWIPNVGFALHLRTDAQWLSEYPELLCYSANQVTYILNKKTIIPFLGRFYRMTMSDDLSSVTFTTVEVPDVAPPDETKMVLPMLTERKDDRTVSFRQVERLTRVTPVTDPWEVICWGVDTAEDGELAVEFSLNTALWNENIREETWESRKTYRVGDIVPFDIHVGYRIHRIQPGNSDGLTGWVEFDPELILLRSGEKTTF
ncbi:MAG: hypothetical protein Q4D38_02935 [Planctomycetia bacterium]|nr:hypothetical protein [Planctomycetia bacterium]